MKDKTIRKGDLVMVVKPAPCCGSKEYLGVTFKVVSVETFNCVSTCCDSMGKALCAAGPDEVGYEISTLIKIDPPSEGETREAYKELTV